MRDSLIDQAFALCEWLYRLAEESPDSLTRERAEPISERALNRLERRLNRLEVQP
jgi:hypothetical protein